MYTKYTVAFDVNETHKFTLPALPRGSFKILLDKLDLCGWLLVPRVTYEIGCMVDGLCINVQNPCVCQKG